jgi:hypothetical protein
MKTNAKILAVALFAFTTAGIACYPLMKDGGTALPPRVKTTGTPPPVVAKQARPKIEVVFALDTTGSMGGLIQAAKEKIWSVATTMAQAQPAPEIRMGLVAYRDRGDRYVTRVFDLTSDLDTMYATLMDFRAEGGGDTPESVNQALDDAVQRISWSGDAGVYKVIFLVGDAPPHMDYQDDVKYPQALAAAQSKGIVVNAIQAGDDGAAKAVWHRIAQAGQGQYAQVGMSGQAVAIATPFDARLAELSARLDETRLYYGSAEAKAKSELKQDAAKKVHESASLASRARRATFNATASGAANLLGEGELVEDVTNGRVDLDKVAPESLPEPMQAMAPAARKAMIEKTAASRGELKREIEQLADQRTQFLKEQVAAEGGAGTSLDHKLYGAIRAQAEKKGMRYEADAPAY